MVIETPALLLLALALLTVPLNWLFAFLAAAAVHEGCHYLALRLLGGRSDGFAVGAGGAVLSISGLGPGAEALCALAGPLGGLLLLPCYRFFPRVAICASLQSGFNLLPIRPLDGGRALQGLLCLLFPVKAEALQWAAETVLCGVLLAVFLSLKHGPVPAAVCFLAIVRALSRKTPCKLRLPGVQ